MGCPESPIWESAGEAWSEDESKSSSDSPEDNVCNEALHIIGLHGSGDKVSLFLKDWEFAGVVVSCYMALDMLCQEMHEGCGERKQKWKGGVAGLCGLSGPVGIFFINFVAVCTPCAFLE